MASGKELPDIGGFIRDLRRNAKISLRQLAQQAGVSNPYLSQIERGLRKPSAEVLQQIASALRVSTPAMYLRAGLLDDKEGHGVLAAIAVDPDLTMAQKQSLSQIYETFRRENARLAEATAAADDARTAPHPGAGRPATPTESASLVNPTTTGPTTSDGTPTEAVLESVAVTEAGAAPAPRTTDPEKKAAENAAPKAAESAEEESS
ncbi:helix-turn-helix domain-containing protein [Micromonospora globbae]|jgi:transcriptional regulator with XRE-family HTH domain|uniref:Helix-turn-helix domain-containing protein n=1 Tax=Micromonospora globbae TaxID=1894969 RepID=A0A420EZ90_9ACTN|nr:helix-turn-helix transcriptional regulator [Micromonospora globbae]RKF26029.1 XRE family transcriptional regulator [Micromonospora globbae]WTF85785.1 helix-turn-helix domain-containing protein [Micromonospora globbae]